MWRDGKLRELSAEIAPREPERQAAARTGDDGTMPTKLGVSVRPLTADEKREAGVDHGLLIEEVGGAAARAGLQPGDVILAANRAPVRNVEDLKAAVDKANRSVALLVQRDDAQIFVPVRIG